MLLPVFAAAQTVEKGTGPLIFNPARHMMTRNTAIAVGVDRFSGQFWVETNKGLPILFSRSNGVTSFSSIHFDGTTYTNNETQGPQTPAFTQRMPAGSAVELSDRIVFTTTITSHEKRLQVTQEFIPSLESDYAFIRIRTSFKNLSSVPVKTGLQLVYDLFIGTVDMFDVRIDGNSITNEQGWLGSSVPDKFEGSAPNYPVLIRGRFVAPDLQKPDRFVVGYWRYNGYLGAATWDYQASGLKIWDVAALAQWNDQSIQPGMELTVTTDYGYLATSDAALRCFADQVSLTPDQSDYTPNPFVVGATVTNVGNLDIPLVSLKLQPPSNVSLAAGETALQSSTALLHPGDSITFRWKIVPTRSDTMTVLHFPIQMVQPSQFQLSCEAEVTLPAVKLQDRCHQAGASTRGSDFWTTLPRNTGGTAYVRPSLFLSAPSLSRVTITCPAASTTTSVLVPAGGVETFTADPYYGTQMQEERVQNLGIHVTSDAPISLYSGSMTLEHSEASIVLPVHALGKRYVTTGYNAHGAVEYFLVIGTEDRTSVTIEPTSTTSGGKQAHVPFQVVLDAGSTYLMRAASSGSAAGLTGSFIESDKPIAVITGGLTGWIPSTSKTPYGFDNPHYEQAIPEHLLGSEYIAVPFRSRLGGDTYIAVATRDSTRLEIGTNSPVQLLRRGDAHEFMLYEASRIASDKPIIVAQFANSARWDSNDSSASYGDAAMVLLAPTERYLNCDQFPTGLDDGYNQVLSVNYGQWIQVKDNPMIALPVFTAECWVKANNRMVIVSRDLPGNALPDWSMVYEFTQHRIEFMTGKDSKPDEYYWSPPASLKQGQWNHVALVVNGPVGTVKVYINGSLSLDTTFAPRDFQVRCGLAWNGYYSNSGGAGGSGLLEECRYWNYERSASQIAATVNKRVPLWDRNGLTGYWSFCGNTEDSSSVANTTASMGSPKVIFSGDLPDSLNCTEPRFKKSFLNIVVHEGGQSQVTLDGYAVPDTAFHSVQSSAFRYAQIPVNGRITSIESADQRGIGVVAYGFDYRDAYAFNAGFVTEPSLSPVSVTQAADICDFTLETGFPNPSHSETRIHFSLEHAAHVRITIADLGGRVCAVLADGMHEQGRHLLRFARGGLPSGVYFCTMKTERATATKKFVVE